MSSAEVSSSLPLTPRRERLHAFLDDQCACQQPADDEASDFLSTCEAIVGELVDPLHSALANIDELEDEFAQQQTSREPNEDADWEKFDIGSIDYPWALKLRLAKVWTPTMRDKVSYLIGNALMWTLAYWLGWSPSSFYKLYTAEVLVLGVVRYGLYRTRKWHYYLLDFCYFANLLLLVHCWLAPRAAWLNKVVFAWGAGPLTWSILAFRNSLVYHDLDKVASVFFHLWPACVVWTLRWHPEAAKFGPGPDAEEGDRRAWEQGGFVSLVLVPMVPYAAWAVAYYLKIFVISAKRIKERGYATLFNYTTTRTKGVYAAIAKRVPKPIQPVVYLLLHALFCATTASLAIACWHSFVVHTLLLGCIGAASVWNGACYYFEVFARGNVRQHAGEGSAAAAGATSPSPVPAASGTKARGSPAPGSKRD